MEKKTELVQFRTTKTRKNNIETRAKQLGISVAKHMENCTDDTEKLLTVFDSFKQETEDIKEAINNSFHYLKQDTETILNSSESNKEYQLINIEKTDINLFKPEDILEANNSLFIIELVLEDGLGIKNLLTMKTSKISEKHLESITSIRRKI